MTDDKLDYKAMAFMHDAPRFWHERNIAVLASQDEATKNDYIQGVIAFAIFLLSFFVLWAMALGYFKWRGIRRYGCVAGQVVYKKDEENKLAAYKRYSFIQYIFIAAFFGLCAGCTMMIKRGVPYLAEAVSDMIKLNNDMSTILVEGQTIATLTANSIANVQKPLTEIRNSTVFPDFCDDQNAALNYTILQIAIDDVADHMGTVKNFLDRYELEGLESNIDIMAERSDILEDLLSTYIGNDWIPKMYVMVIGILSFFLCCYTIITGWCGFNDPAVKFVTCYFVLPVFTLVVTLGWCIMILFSAGSIMNSDFCIGDGVTGPEATVEEALVQYGIKEDHLMFQSFLFYKSQCTITNPWDDEVTKQLSSIKHSGDILGNLMLKSENITSACGTKVIPLIANIESLNEQLPLLTSGMEKGKDLAKCDRMLPLYNDLFNGATCSESLKGLSWSFYAMFAISMCGIIMVSLRSALYYIKAIHNDDMRENLDCFDEMVDWDEFTRNQIDNDSEWVEYDGSETLSIKRKRSVDTNITLTASDEELATEVGSEERNRKKDCFSPAAISNQSSIDSNEYYHENDDSVNSFNSELEPLTPSPTSFKREAVQSSTPPSIAPNKFFLSPPATAPSTKPDKHNSPHKDITDML